MKRLSIVMILLLISVHVYSQSRDDIRIFINPITSPNFQHPGFFQSYLAEEIVGAGYAITDNRDMADYLFTFTISYNEFIYDDGTTGRGDGIEDPIYEIRTTLRDSEGNEMVSFSMLFTEMEEAYEWGLTMIYQTTANIPLTKLGDIEVADISDRWRNKWIYVRTSIDGVATVNNVNTLLQSNPPAEGFPSTTIPAVTDRILFMPGALRGPRISLFKLDECGARLCSQVRQHHREHVHSRCVPSA